MEQSKGIAGLNMLTVLMVEMDCTLQEATDHAGRAFHSLIDTYERDKNYLPSWGPEIDAQVGDFFVCDHHHHSHKSSTEHSKTTILFFSILQNKIKLSY